MARRRRDIQPRVQLRPLTRASGGSPRRKLAWGPSSGAASASPISSRVSARLGGGTRGGWSSWTGTASTATRALSAA